MLTLALPHLGRIVIGVVAFALPARIAEPACIRRTIAVALRRDAETFRGRHQFVSGMPLKRW